MTDPTPHEATIGGLAARDEEAPHLQELRELADRSRLGGFFYAIAWLLIAANDDIAQRFTAVVAVGALAFIALGVQRFTLRPSPQLDAAQARAGLQRVWAVILTTAALWGAASAWTVNLPQADAARAVAIMATIAFGTAMAHTFCTRILPAVVGIALLCLPVMISLLQLPGQRALAVVVAVYLIYVVLALLRSHREYRERLALEAELRRQRDLYENQSRRDGLTGLANRRRFESELSKLVAVAQGGGDGFALTIFDLDHFKHVNDRHGHAVGDACLIAFAERLRTAFAQRGELCARLGGEEFAVLLPQVGVHEALLRADALRASLGKQALAATASGVPVIVTTSGGASAHASGANGSAAEIFRAADAALYRAKASGRDAVCSSDATSETSGARQL
jgi:diguanylate cyclase (GGDEF)-like protein